MTETSGTCFGYRVESERQIDYLRSGAGERLVLSGGPEPTQPGPLITRWERSNGRPFSARLHENGRGFELWIEGTGWFVIDPFSGHIRLSGDLSDLRHQARVWGIPSALCFTERGDLPLHGAAVDVDGKALLIAAPGRHGKTTLATAFHNAGHRMLAEDLACCRVSGTDAEILPGPALLRLRPDVHEALKVPDTTVLRRDPDRVYLAIDPERRGTGDPVPLAGILFLRPAQELELESVDPDKAIPDLWALSLTLPTDEARARTFDRLARLATASPCWNLYRPEGISALPNVVDEVIATCLS